MRRTFIECLCELASNDERIMLLTADIGYSVVEPFQERFPERFLNVGVAEQNMIGVATGLAMNGYIPFCYSITPFVTLRPLEFILRGPVLHELPVRIVGAGRGQQYGVNGPTHWATEAGQIMAYFAHAGYARCFVPDSADDVRECVGILCDLGDVPWTAFVSLSKDGCS